MEESNKIRVRMAPSPTGLLHVGTARTALFNWLFARSLGGKFIMRIEDTDKERSLPEYEKDILEGLAWLGLEWDEGVMLDGSFKGEFGPYRQSQRTDRYRVHLEALLSSGQAYFCGCSEEQLEEDRRVQEERKEPVIYGGRCRDLGLSEGVIRFRMPEGKISFFDKVREEVEFEGALIGDFVVAKSLSEPLYNFAVVVDDWEMKISHVIRGEDHISNTPKQIAIAKALGAPVPDFAHIPLILNPDRTKLSKRNNKVSMGEYISAGYLPAAMLNFLALLGWHPSGDREFFTPADLIKEFSITRVQKSGAVFNLEKLDWLNKQHLRSLSAPEIFALLPQETRNQLKEVADEARSIAAIEIAKEKLENLRQFPSEWMYLLASPQIPDSREVCEKDAAPGNSIKVLEEVVRALEEDKDLQLVLEEISSRMGGRGGVYWPVRVALSGLRNSAGPLQIASVIGREETIARLRSTLDAIAK